MLEVIAGEIAHEFDTDEPENPVGWVKDHWEAGGLVTLTDLDRVLDAGIAFCVKSNAINRVEKVKIFHQASRGKDNTNSTTQTEESAKRFPC